MRQLDDNPDRDFSAGYEVLQSVPKYTYRDLLDDPVICERIGELIAWAVDHRPAIISFPNQMANCA